MKDHRNVPRVTDDMLTIHRQEIPGLRLIQKLNLGNITRLEIEPFDLELMKARPSYPDLFSSEPCSVVFVYGDNTIEQLPKTCMVRTTPFKLFKWSTWKKEQQYSKSVEQRLQEIASTRKDLTCVVVLTGQWHDVTAQIFMTPPNFVLDTWLTAEKRTYQAHVQAQILHRCQPTAS